MWVAWEMYITYSTHCIHPHYPVHRKQCKVYCMTKNFRDKKLSQNAVQQCFSKKNSQKGVASTHMCMLPEILRKKRSRYSKIREIHKIFCHELYAIILTSLGLQQQPLASHFCWVIPLKPACQNGRYVHITKHSL